MIIASIIKLEYEVNAIELSIKKVLGHSIWQKNKKIISITLFSTVISVGIATISAQLFKWGSYHYLLIGGLVIIVSELLTITLFIRKIERTKIQKILKGGNI